MRTGADYLASLNDGRVVLVDGEQIDDVTTHPAFAPIAHTIGGLFDLAADPANGMQTTDPSTGHTWRIRLDVPDHVSLDHTYHVTHRSN